MKGDPFYNVQARNVYFGMFGDNNWGHNMPKAESITSLSQVVFAYPGTFMRHYYNNLLGIPRLELVQFPLGLLAYSGMISSLCRGKPHCSTLLVINFVVLFSLAIAMAFLRERLLLPVSAILCIFAAYACAAFFPPRLRFVFPQSLPIRWPVAMGLCFWLSWTYVRPAILHPLPEYDRNRIKVSQVLAQQGVQQAYSVLCFSFDYYDMTKKTKDRYALPWARTDFEPYRSVEDIAQRMAKADKHFLVFDKSAPANVPGLDKFWPFDPQEISRFFEPILTLPGSVYIYRLRD